MRWLSLALRKISDWLEWASYQLGWVAGGLAAVMMLTVMREVVGRYFLNKPTDWSLELNEYLLVGMAYMGAAFTEQIEGHIRIDFIYERFRGKTKKLADIIIAAISMIWVIFIMWQGGKVALHSLLTGARSPQAMMWPLFPSQVTIPIGSFLLCVVLLGKMVRNIKSLGRMEE